jgi:hypothetical protein
MASVLSRGENPANRGDAGPSEQLAAHTSVVAAIRIPREHAKRWGMGGDKLSLGRNVRTVEELDELQGHEESELARVAY